MVSFLRIACGKGGREGAMRVRAYFEITCVMRVLGRAEEAQASMRAWRLEPLPEMRTTRLYWDSDMVGGCNSRCGRKGEGAEVRGCSAKD